LRARGQRSRRTNDRKLWPVVVATALVAFGFGRRKATPAAAADDSAPEQARYPHTEGPGAAHGKTRRVWLEVIRLLYGAIGQHRVVSIAAGVTFFALLALFPAIAALVSTYGLFADPATIHGHVDSLLFLLPEGALSVIGDQLERVSSAGKSTLGATFALTLAISLWSANAGMKALFDALNIVYGATESRGLIKLNAVSLAFTAGGLVLMALAAGVIVVLPITFQHVGLAPFTGWIMAIGRWPVLYCLLVVVLAVIYRLGPDREQAQWQWITWGSAIAASVWIVASILFSWYAANFGSYNTTYGSLGAVVGFMTWIWISCMVILAGAEIDAIMERLDRGSAT
jgi:membrane protein